MMINKGLNTILAIFFILAQILIIVSNVNDHIVVTSPDSSLVAVKYILQILETGCVICLIFGLFCIAMIFILEDSEKAKKIAKKILDRFENENKCKALKNQSDENDKNDES